MASNDHTHCRQLSTHMIKDMNLTPIHPTPNEEANMAMQSNMITLMGGMDCTPPGMAEDIGMRVVAMVWH